MNNVSITNNNPRKSLFKFTAYFMTLLALGMLSNSAFATADLGVMADNITSSLVSVARLITSLSYVIGVGFALMGMLKFKAHKDNPTQVPLSQPMVLLAISTGLIFLPSLISSGGQTLWAGVQKSASVAWSTY